MSDTIKQIIVIAVFFGIPAVVGAWLASTKGRSSLLWFFVCGFFPPTIMIIFNQNPLREVNGHYRRCPACNEMQAWKNADCKYCGSPMQSNDNTQS